MRVVILAVLVALAGGAVGEDKATAYKERAERQRLVAVAGARAQVVQLQKELDAVRFAKVGGTSKRDFPTSAARDAAVKAKLTELVAARGEVESLEKSKGSYVPALGELEIGAVGTIGRVKVIQVVDDQNMIVHYFGQSLWVTTPTAGVVDGAIRSVPGPFEVAGTKRYTTAGGSSNTIFHARPFAAPK